MKFPWKSIIKNGNPKEEARYLCWRESLEENDSVHVHVHVWSKFSKKTGWQFKHISHYVNPKDIKFTELEIAKGGYIKDTDKFKLMKDKKIIWFKSKNKITPYRVGWINPLGKKLFPVWGEGATHYAIVSKPTK